MSDMAERLVSPISTAELERRWAAVRAAMAAQNIDVLVMQNSNEFSGGYVKWFTDMPSGNGTMTTIIFPKDDLMTVVAPGPFGVDVRSPAGDSVQRGVTRYLASPNFMAASFTTARVAEISMRLMRALSALFASAVTAMAFISLPSRSFFCVPCR